MRHLYLVMLLPVLGLLTACGSTPEIPKGTKVGKPYTINGVTYYPSPDDDYDRTGTASWYGPGFHGKKTANGETYNKNDFTAAHPTLPMPSVVRVTNLENGKSVIVRINDRGPFKKNRIIDLSRKAARTIGIHGLAEVRVQYLPEETQRFRDSVERGKPLDMAELNNNTQKLITEETSGLPSTPIEPIAPPLLTVDKNESLEEARPTLIRSAKAEQAPSAAPAEPPQSPPPRQALSAIKPQAMPVNLFKEKPTVAPAAQKSPPARNNKGASGRHVILAGSFSNEINARNLEKKLQVIAPVRVDRVPRDGKEWWRVKVGPFDDGNIAAEALSKVRSLGVPDAKIIH